MTSKTLSRYDLCWSQVVMVTPRAMPQGYKWGWHPVPAPPLGRHDANATWSFPFWAVPKVKVVAPGSHSHSLRACSSAETSLGEQQQAHWVPVLGLGCLNPGISNLGLTWVPFLDEIPLGNPAKS